MEGEHTPTIIRLILLTDLTLIQLKDSLFNSSFSQQMGDTTARVSYSKGNVQEKEFDDM